MMTQIMMARCALALQASRLIFKQGGTKIAAPSRKTHQRPSYGLVSSREVQNPVQADRKPLARYGAIEGALARGLLPKEVPFGCRYAFRNRLTAGAVKQVRATERLQGSDGVPGRAKKAAVSSMQRCQTSA